ncbi:MAG: TAXI family TRAP transporter solute-binding subunit [Fibrobacter sp.]|nr:TAXI family TRAP transporter solute-binding subunit [Fibrobacter sp.]
MKLSTFSLKALSIAFLTTTALLLSSCQSEKQTVRFGSGNKGGLYDKFATSFAQRINTSNKSYLIQIKNTEGSHANIRLIEEGFIDLGIVQADILKDYLMRSRKVSAIAAVAGLYTESIQIVVSADSDIKTIADLQGHRVSVGEEESGVLRNAEIILEAYGITFDKIQKENLSFKAAATALKEGRIDAFFCTAGIPTPSISDLATTKNIRILSMDSTDISRIMNLHQELTVSEIPANTYAGQDSAVQTLGAKAVLIASQLLDDSIVAKITEEVFIPDYEHTSNIPVGFHPGAATVYKSKNINVKTAAPLPARAPIPSTGD